MSDLEEATGKKARELHGEAEIADILRGATSVSMIRNIFRYNLVNDVMA
jgi:hypothetical protein